MEELTKQSCSYCDGRTGSQNLGYDDKDAILHLDSHPQLFE